MIKRVFIALLMAICTLHVMADDFSLYVTTSGASSEYQLSSLQKITFSNGNVVLTTSSGKTVSFAISSISKMYFGATSTAIQQLAADSQATWDGTSLVFDSGRGIVNIYRPSGLLVASQTIDGGATISLADLPRGVYIVRIDGKSFKISKR